MKGFREVLTCAVLALLLAGCTVRPNTGGEPHNRRDIPAGPGLFSGPDGKFVIERRG